MDAFACIAGRSPAMHMQGLSNHHPMLLDNCGHNPLTQSIALHVYCIKCTRLTTSDPDLGVAAMIKCEGHWIFQERKVHPTSLKTTHCVAFHCDHVKPILCCGNTQKSVLRLWMPCLVAVDSLSTAWPLAGTVRTPEWNMKPSHFDSKWAQWIPCHQHGTGADNDSSQFSFVIPQQGKWRFSLDFSLMIIVSRPKEKTTPILS